MITNTRKIPNLQVGPLRVHSLTWQLNLTTVRLSMGRGWDAFTQGPRTQTLQSGSTAM